MWNHFYIEMLPHFLRKQLFSHGQNLVTSLYRNNSTFLKKTNYSVWAKNLVTSLDRNASTFLEKTIIQSLPKIWLHLYKEMIPHFLRIQCFYIKMRFFRQCYLYGINSISVIDAPL